MSSIRTVFVCVIAVLTASVMSHAEEAGTPPVVKPPVFKILAASTGTLGDQPWASFKIEVTNPNEASLIYTGYTPNSFDPPLQPGHIVPLVSIEFQTESLWRRYPMGFCGTGLDDLELAPKSSSTFEVSAPAGDWDAIKIGFGQMAGWSRENQTTSTTWSIVVTRAEFEKLSKPSLPVERTADE